MSDQQENLPDYPSDESPPAPKKGVDVRGRRISFGALAAWIGIFALLGLLAVGLLRNQEGPVTVGETVPNFTLTTFDGEQISLRELEDKVVVLNF
ncbi:MAG: redoxin domain-containing protein, partial [Anaerolineales bacterium]|nr:redoxin domain-containing protein [Anaerolineales bacterium]